MTVHSLYKVGKAHISAVFLTLFYYLAYHSPAEIFRRQQRKTNAVLCGGKAHIALVDVGAEYLDPMPAALGDIFHELARIFRKGGHKRRHIFIIEVAF